MKKLFLATLILLFFSDQLLSQPKKLNFAFFPYVSPSKLIMHNKNLKDFLQKELGIDISIITARNSKAYLDGIKKGSYDFIFSAPHIGRFSELKYDYQRIAMTTNKIQGLYLVKKSSPMKSLADLEGKTISMANPITILHQIALDDLKESGLINGKNITINVTKNHINSIHSLIKGKSDVALTGVKLWHKMNPKYKDSLRLLQSSSKSPGFLIMGNKEMKKELLLKIQNALLKFSSTPKGKKYLFKGFKLVDEQSMQSLNKYIDVLN